MAKTSLYRDVRDDFRATWKDLLVADLAYSLLAFVVIAPLTAVALRLFLATSGRTVAADQDIALFLLSPVGMIALIVIAAVLIAAVGLQVACLMTIGQGHVRGGRIGAAASLQYGLRRAGAIIGISYRLFLRCLLLALPFLAVIGGLYFFFLREYDINYYLTEKPPEFKICASIALVLVAILAVLLIRRILNWVFALPLLLFEGISAGDALSESETRTPTDHLEILKVLVAWLLFWLAVATLVTGLVGLLTGWLVPRFEHRLGLLALVVGGSLALTTGVNLALSFLQRATFSLLVGRLYQRLGEPRHGYAPFEELLEESSETGLLEWLRVRMSTRMLLASLFGFALIAAAIGMVSLRGVSTVDDVEIIGHRGASSVAPENTLASVAAALEQGADWVEIDVQESADGEIVVMHDSDLMKIAGVDLKVWDSTWEQLRAVDIGSRFAPEFADQRVPKLVEVLEMCRGRSGVNIELKYYGHDDRLAERVIEIVERAGMVDSVVLMSLNLGQVQEAKQLRPDWTVGLLTAKALGDLTSAEADFLAVNTGIASAGFVRRAGRAGKPVLTWTVNSPAAMSAMISRGADGLITDYPALAREVLEQRRELSSAQRLLVDLGFLLDSLDDEASSEEDA